MTHELKHLDLFTGIGGFHLAAERAGFRTIAFSEVDPYCCQLLADRWPDVPNVGDVRIAANFARFRGATVLTAGYPCQPESYAGNRRGANDDRWLWPAARGVLQEVRPTWFIGENVLGHVTLGLDQVLNDLENDGYSAQPVIVPACAVDAWHIRARVWILAYDDRRGGRSNSTAWNDPNGKDTDRKETNGLPGAICEGLSAHVEYDARRSEQRIESGKRKNSCAENLPVLIGGGENASDDVRTGCADIKGFGKKTEIARQPTACCDYSGDGRFRQWPPESRVVRVVHGIPARSHQVKVLKKRNAALGNAIVPQVAEPFFRWIAQIEAGEIA